MKVAVCVIVKNENPYIREFVDYYKNLGFTNVILYDNNDSIDGEDILPIINDYIESGFLIYNEYKDKTVCQSDAYNECYSNYKNDYDWICFFDTDEFISINTKTINELLSNERYNNFNIIKLAWRVYGDNNQLYYEDKPVLERFTDAPHIQISHFAPNYKCIVRTTLPFIHYEGPHYISDNKYIKACNSLGISINNNRNVIINDFSNCYLKHMWCKSTEEFIQKMSRGYPDQIVNNAKILSRIKTYFLLNKVTQEKILMFKEAFPHLNL